MRSITSRRWWRRYVAPVVRDHRMLVVAAGPLLGALLGVVTNLITGGWRWWLFVLLVVLVVAATLQVVYLTREEAGHRLPPPGLLSTGMQYFSGKLYGRRGPHERLLTAVRDRGAQRIQVVHSLAGEGTSALASSVGAYRETDGVLVRWVDGAQPTTLFGGLLEVSAELAAPGDPIAEDPTNLLWSRLHRAARDRELLLIIDGLDDVALLGGLHRWLRRPPPNATVIITTTDGRRRNFPPQLIRFHRIGGLTPAKGGQLLTDLAPDAGPAAEARKLSERLGGHPLALVLAARYLVVAGPGAPRTFRAYRESIRGRSWMDRLLGAPKPLAAVLERSLDLASEAHPQAVLFLGLVSCISPEPIPLILLEHSDHNLVGAGFPRTWILEMLSSFGLVRLTGVGREQVVHVHPLVQALVRTHPEVRRAATRLRTLVKWLKANPPQDVPDNVRKEFDRALFIDVPEDELPAESLVARLWPGPPTTPPSAPRPPADPPASSSPPGPPTPPTPAGPAGPPKPPGPRDPASGAAAVPRHEIEPEVAAPLPSSLGEPPPAPSRPPGGVRPVPEVPDAPPSPVHPPLVSLPGIDISPPGPGAVPRLRPGAGPAAAPKRRPRRPSGPSRG